MVASQCRDFLLWQVIKSTEEPSVSGTFEQAVTAVMERHNPLSWSALSQSQRAKEICSEMRKIDPESTKGWLVLGTEQRAA